MVGKTQRLRKAPLGIKQNNDFGGDHRMSREYIVCLDSYPEVVSSLPLGTPNRLAVIDGYWANSIAFDQDSRWLLCASGVPEFNLFERFLARTIWTPKEPIQLEWGIKGPFTVDEFSAVTKGWLSIDPGDLIVQFFDADQVLRLWRFPKLCGIG